MGNACVDWLGIANLACNTAMVLGLAYIAALTESRRRETIRNGNGH